MNNKTTQNELASFFYALRQKLEGLKMSLKKSTIRITEILENGESV